jgi:hypothetical protein
MRTWFCAFARPAFRRSERSSRCWRGWPPPAFEAGRRWRGRSCTARSAGCSPTRTPPGHGGRRTAEQVMDRDGRHRVHGAQPLEDEEAVALRRRRQRPQPLVPGEDVPHQCRRLERRVASEGPPLLAPGAGLEPHQRLAVLQQGNVLQAVAPEFGDGLGVAGRVDQDGQVVRQQRDGARVQVRLDLLGAAPAAHGDLQPLMVAAACSKSSLLGMMPPKRRSTSARSQPKEPGLSPSTARCAAADARTSAWQRCPPRRHAGWRAARVPSASRVGAVAPRPGKGAKG